MKKLSAFLCCTLLFMTLVSPVSASAEGVRLGKVDASSYSLNEGISPRWVSVVTMTGAIESGLFGSYKAYGSVSADHADYKITATCTIQTSNSGSWTDTDITWSKSDRGSVEASKSWISLSSGSYRIKIVAVVNDASGKYIETATGYVGERTI